MREFANLRDAGRQLASGVRVSLGDASSADAVLVAVLPNGVPVALALAESLEIEVIGLPLVRSDDGVTVAADLAALAGALAGRTAIVVDDGVETGTVARAVVEPLRAAGPDRLVLAVPVCPREAIAELQHRYDAIVAVSTPLVRRDLAWHYRDFDRIDDAAALRLLAGT